MSEAVEWTTERWPVANLKDWPNNPRRITEKGLADLKASMTRLGYIDPIAINTDGTIIGGHARKRVLKEMKVKDVEVRVPSRTLTEKEIEEAIIRLNKNIAGEWSFDILANAFEQQDLLDWGFTPEEFGIPQDEEKPAKEVKDMEGYFVLAEFADEAEQEDFFNELNSRGVKCKLML